MALDTGAMPAHRAVRGRRMFEVTAAETMDLARAQAMACVHHSEAGDGLLNRPGVTWDRLAFAKGAHLGIR